ncbi:MAG: hypothetical protein IPL19_05365 [Sandaracinaceae bacterium]|nr:hypothetical protein [Sandaracinaceae bacterium]MBK7151074.1 hypothetical protein [Sandaracinaceae bacterium]MBK7776581.1 hypothetical protein [Sandaracinaceae bacterium]MBK8407402.1 hypothetical protein [Sandaracinaceae bacterium]
MNTTESVIRFSTAAGVSVLLLLLSTIPVLAQEAAELQPAPDSPLRTTIETGLSISAWRSEYRIESASSPTYDNVLTCPAAMGTNTRLGIGYRVGRRAELGGFATYDFSRPRACSNWNGVDHELHTVTVGPALVLRPLAAPGLFFRVGAGATWVRGKPMLNNWEPRGVGASADVGYEFFRGRRATLFVSGGLVANFAFDSQKSNNPDFERQEWSLASRSLAGTLRIGASLR